MKKIICLYGGPGAGKSTLAAGLFYRLKCLGLTCEMNREYIKDWVWEGRKIRPGDQTYYFAKQARKERVYMENGVDVIITDSPLILTHFYGLKYDHFEQTSNTSLVMLKHHHEVCKYYGFKVEHFVLTRTKAYDPKGRNQDEATAKQYDAEIQDMLDSVGIKYTKIDANSGEDALDQIVEYLRNPPLKEDLVTSIMSSVRAENWYLDVITDRLALLKVRGLKEDEIKDLQRRVNNTIPAFYRIDVVSR